MRIGEVAPAITMIALSAVVALGTWSLGLWDGFTPGPAFVPILVSTIGVALAALRLFEARLSPSGGLRDWPDRPTLTSIALTVIGLAAFAILAPLIGMIAAAVMLTGFLLIGVLRQPLLPSLLAVAVTTGMIYAIFVWWLGLRLPQGVLGI